MEGGWGGVVLVHGRLGVFIEERWSGLFYFDELKGVYVGLMLVQILARIEHLSITQVGMNEQE